MTATGTVTEEGPDELDQLLNDLVRHRRTTRDTASPLDAFLEPDSATEREEEPERSSRQAPNLRGRPIILLSFILFSMALSGILADVIAASQIVADSGPATLGWVWPLGGLVLLISGVCLVAYIDRFDRRRLLITMFLLYATGFGLVLLLSGLGIHGPVPPAISWALADQINFLLPLVVWAAAGDLFSTGQAVSVFPSLSRWFFIGQTLSLLIATFVPIGFDLTGTEIMWLLSLPTALLAIAGICIHRGFAHGTLSQGSGASEPAARVLRGTYDYVHDLKAFRWIFRSSLLVLLAGVLIEWTFLDDLSERIHTGGGIQAAYAGASLAGFAICWVVQHAFTTSLLNRVGLARTFYVLPLATALGAVAMIVASRTGWIPFAVGGLLAWRVPRWSVDASARQASLATVPDQRRASVGLLIDLAPIAIGMILMGAFVGIEWVIGNNWIIGAAALALAAGSLLGTHRTVQTWDETQLSYKLKRRSRVN